MEQLRTDMENIKVCWLSDLNPSGGEFLWENIKMYLYFQSFLNTEMAQVWIWMIRNHIYYPQTSDIRCTLVGNKMVDHSDVVGAAPAIAASTTSSFFNLTPGLNGLGKDNCKTRRETLKFLDLVHLTLEVWQYIVSTMDADGPVTEGIKASAATALT